MLKFLAFADLHYFKNVYHASVESLEKIMSRAASEGVDFAVHLGDFSNHYVDSPEIVEAYLNNPQGIPVYGVYGNHELEKSGTMALVSATMSNQAVSFGTEEGMEQTGYWYFDVKGYRLIGLDTNYMYHEEEGRYYHNAPETWPFVKGTVRYGSLGDAQFSWLRSVLADAHEKGLSVLVFAHYSFSGIWNSAPDAEKVRELFAKNPGTVKMALNGHLHTDRFAVRDGVAYFDVNTAHNGFWKPHPDHHYTPDQTFSYTPYEGGVRGDTVERPLCELRQAKNTWFFTEPTSAIVTLEELPDGRTEIRIEGCETEWMYGVLPPSMGDEAVYPGIRSRTAVV